MDLRRGGQKWDQYVRMVSLDLVQQMDGVPYRVHSLGAFESQLAIDVGYDRRHIAISLCTLKDLGEALETPELAVIADEDMFPLGNITSPGGRLAFNVPDRER